MAEVIPFDALVPQRHKVTAELPHLFHQALESCANQLNVSLAELQEEILIGALRQPGQGGKVIPFPEAILCQP